MTPEQAQQLAEHAATVWPDVLVSVWAAGLVRYDFGDARAALGRLRVRDVRQVGLETVAAEIAAGRAPCPECGGAGWVSSTEPAPVRFEHDLTDQPVTLIQPPELDPDADRAQVARAWAAAIRDRQHAPVLHVARTVPVTRRCTRCSPNAEV